MKLTKEDIELLQRYMANELNTGEKQQLEQQLNTNKDMQDAKKILSRIPDASEQYFDQKARKSFDTMYNEVKEEQPYQPNKIVPFYLSNFRKLAAIFLIGISLAALWGINYVTTSNQQLAAENVKAVQEYYTDLENERGPDDSKKTIYLNTLEENYTLGKDQLNSQNYITAIEKFNAAYDLAVKEQNPLQFEIKLLLALSHLGADNSETANTMLKELIEEKQLPNALQPAIKSLLNKLAWKQKLPF